MVSLLGDFGGDSLFRWQMSQALLLEVKHRMINKDGFDENDEIEVSLAIR